MAIQNRVAAMREARGYSAADLARRIGVTRQAVYAIEAGSYVPNTALALRLARELGVGVEDLFHLEETQEEPKREARVLVLGGRVGGAVALARVGDALVAAEVETGGNFLREADGLLVRGSRVEVLGDLAVAEKRVVIAGCDPAIGILAEMARRETGVEVLTVAATSKQALDWLKRGLVHMAGSHLLDAATGAYNLPQLRRLMPDGEIAVFTFARWQEGLVVKEANPKAVHGVGDLAKPGLRIVNREKGSGSRVLLDALLREAGMGSEGIEGYEEIRVGHLGVAREVASGNADCCIATMSAARVYGLGFVPLREERFDIAVRREWLSHPGVKGVLETLQRAGLRRKLEGLAGYDVRETGKELA